MAEIELPHRPQQVVDLGSVVRDGQRSHFVVTLRRYADYEDTAKFTRPPAAGFSTWLVQMCDHTGTHIDAPSHFLPGARSIDELPADTFVGHAVCIDCTKSNDAAGASRQGEGDRPGDPDHRPPADLGPRRGSLVDTRVFRSALTRADLSVSRGDIVLLRLGDADSGGYSGVDEDLAQYLLDSRIKMLGVDRPTPDDPANPGMPVHVILLTAGIPIVENLRNLDEVAGKTFTYVGAPLKLSGATGAPVNPIALL